MYNKDSRRETAADKNLREIFYKVGNTIQYKGYVGSVEFSEEDEIFTVRLWESDP